MKFLGIDYGAKRIGLASSDDSGSIAFPKGIIKNDKNALDKIADMIKREKIGGLVIGESSDLVGNKNPIMEEIKRFAANVERQSNLSVIWEKEFLTTVEARRSAVGKTKIQHNRAKMVAEPPQKEVDDSAAALILQRFLDRKNK